MSTTRKSPKVSSSAAAKRASCFSPRRPVARSWRGRYRGGEHDQRHRAAPAHKWKLAGLAFVAAHIFAPELGRQPLRLRYIDVVIAESDGHVGRRSERLQPCARPRILRRQRQIDQVAGHGDVVGAAGLEVARDRIERLDAVHFLAPTMPVDEAEPALAGKLDEARPHGQVQIGEVGKREHGVERDTPNSDRQLGLCRVVLLAVPA